MLPHDPGGSIRYPVSMDVFGRAEFAGENDCHRLMLSRQMNDCEVDEPYALWCGTNPSTAEADIDDPTVRREWGFTQRWGFKAYVKVNVMSYRATFPKDLLAAGVVPSHELNLPTILDWAKNASLIVCCWGSVHPKLRHHAEHVESALRDAGHSLCCLHLTKGGMPGHPLYLPNNSKLIPFERRVA
jgi:hypothetical protein